MKYLSIFYLFIGLQAVSQTFTHPNNGNPNNGNNSTFSGACPESTCTGIYQDDNFFGSNYGNNTNNVYQTFCPDSPGTCLRATFTQFVTETPSFFFGPWDWLTIANGPSPISPVMIQAPTNASGQLTGNLSGSTPFSFTANNSSGCLTFRFRSDGSGVAQGWNANLSCVPCAARLPDGLSDCLSGALQVCTNNPLVGISPGPGSTHEGCAGCADSEGEIYSSWYYFEIATSGTLAFDLVPDVFGEDLDFALYGPNVDCNTLGVPVRCQYAANTGNGGMTGTGGVNSSGVSGPAYVNQLNVTAGEQYVLLINNWSAGAGGYTINWNGSASLECTSVPLPVEYINFSGLDKAGYNELTWTTGSERDNEYFRIERSTDGQFWIPISDVKGAGNSSTALTYSIEDRDIENNIIYYYRLKQFDYDGKMDTHDDIVAILNNHAKPHIIKVVNLIGQEVGENTKGLVFEIYSDGSRVKKFKQ